jgi:hypothetical protein
LGGGIVITSDVSASGTASVSAAAHAAVANSVQPNAAAANIALVAVLDIWPDPP